MTENNINLLKGIGLDEYCISDLSKRIDNVINLKNDNYNRGYYMGYITALLCYGVLPSRDFDSLAVAVEDL